MAKAKFESKNEKLFIDGKEVIRGWESFSGWYWFATELSYKQDSQLQDGTIIKDDEIYFGLVQGFEEEWGYFSKGEIEAVGKYKVWPIPQKNLHFSGRRS